MASSPSESEAKTAKAGLATESSVAFALQELTVCWSQAYEAMTRGDLQGVAALLDQAEHQLEPAGDGSHDSEHESRLRNQAVSAYGRLQHAMKSGLTGLRDELGQTRRGAKAMRGYGGAVADLGTRVTRHA